MTPELLNRWRNSKLGLLDIRSFESFTKFHIKDSTHFPLCQLSARMHELPARPSELWILGPPEELEGGKLQIEEKGYSVAGAIPVADEDWENNEISTWIESGSRSNPLWSCVDFLRQSLAQIEANTSGRRAVDLACGAGRDAVYLAMQGWQVCGIDNNEDALSRMTALAASHQTQLKAQLLDIESDVGSLELSKADLYVVVRYLHRPLMQVIAEAINPGGFILYVTFLKGAEKYGKPKNPNHLLDPGELAAHFSGFTIYHDLEITDEKGRPMNALLAQKPST